MDSDVMNELCLHSDAEFTAFRISEVWNFPMQIQNVSERVQLLSSSDVLPNCRHGEICCNP